MPRDLSTFPFPAHVRFKMYSNGFTTDDDLKNINQTELEKETDLTKEEAVEVLNLVSSQSNASTIEQNEVIGISALDVLKEEKSKPSIPTFCQALDNILGGGVPLRKVTEICGVAGVGKTQICFQLCVNVQIPEVCGGLEGEALYIDTEGSFAVSRLIQIATSAVENCKKIANGADIKTFTTNKILDHIHYFHCKSYTELIAKIHVLPEFLKQRKKVALLIIDSIAFHFRYGFEGSYRTRSKVLNELSLNLLKISNEFNLAVLVTNQMTTRIHKSESALVPALGESWGHACTIRLILSRDDQKRQALLFKSPWMKEDTALYQITANGIRDYTLPEVINENSSDYSSSHKQKKLKTEH